MTVAPTITSYIPDGADEIISYYVAYAPYGPIQVHHFRYEDIRDECVREIQREHSEIEITVWEHRSVR